MLTLGQRDQPKRLIFMDHSALLPKDPLVAAANLTTAEWEKKTKEVKRKNKQGKLRA